jgi:hypothetical protein
LSSISNLRLKPCVNISKNCFSDNMAKACMVGLSYTHADVYSACNSTYHVNCEVKNNHRQLLLQCSPLIIVESEITEACFLINNKWSLIQLYLWRKQACKHDKSCR